MKLSLPLLAILASSLPFAANGATIINLAGTDSVGQSLTLAAGTYQVNVVGTSTAGALYNGWNLFTSNFGQSNASPAPNGWTERFGITIGGVNTVYDLQGMALNASASDALSAVQKSVLYTSHGTIASNSNGVMNTATFTLNSTQNVQFAVSDSANAYGDNWGGESLKLSSVTAATPEPSTFGFMGLAMAGVAGTLRKKIFNLKK